MVYYYTTHQHIERQSDGKWSEVECRHGKSWSTTTRHTNISNVRVVENGVKLSAEMVSHGNYYTTHRHIECPNDGKWSEVECRHGKSWSI